MPWQNVLNLTDNRNYRDRTWRYAYIFLLTGSVLFCIAARAQDPPFTPVTENTALLGNLAGQYEQTHRDELGQLPSANRKDYEKIYNSRWLEIRAKFDKQEIYTAPDAQAYLDKLAGVIVRGNPVLKEHPFHCYFSRSYVPNASYIGEGIILFNMGLLDRLTDESQAAFILCHEISHYLRRHQEKSIEKYVTRINSPEMQAELRKIKGAEYRQGQQVQNLVKGLTFDSRRHSRDHESEADSMAVELMRNTPFALAGATSTLALLDSVDKDGFDPDSFLPTVFNAGEYPFRKKWLAREEGLLGGHARLKKAGDEGLADSLKTHPDCALRVRLIAPMVAASAGPAYAKASAGKPAIGKASAGEGAAFPVDSAEFRRLRERSRYEVIEYAFAAGEYTESLWLALELLQQRPDDPYAVAQVGTVLNGIYAAQKTHTLGKVVELPAPGYPGNYNSLLQFVQNLYLEDWASISYYFLQRHHPGMDHYERFRKAYVESARIRAEQE